VAEGASLLDTLDPARRRSQLRRAIVASAVGTSIEWYDFYLYGSAAVLVFPHKFFPESDPFTGALLSYSTYFVGFASRPLGAAIFGHFGDRLGRKISLIATLMLMGLATAGIGLVPGYDQIGIWGAVLLTFGRLLQGIGVGGEWGGSVLLAAEWSSKRHRGFVTSWPHIGAPVGLVLANGPDAPLALGWAGRAVVAPGLLGEQHYGREEWLTFLDSEDPDSAYRFLAVYKAPLYVLVTDGSAAAMVSAKFQEPRFRVAHQADGVSIWERR